MNLAAEPIRSLISEGKATLLSAQAAIQIDAGIDAYPRPATGHWIDWNQVSNTSKIHWLQASDKEVLDWFSNLAIWHYPTIILWSNPYDDCLWMQRDEVMNRLDLLVSYAGEGVYLVGADETGQPDPLAIVEVTSGPIFHGTI